MRRLLQLLFALAVLLPLANLALWVFVEYWPWPSVFPERYSLRSLSALMGEGRDFWAVMLTGIGIALVTALASVLIGMMSARALSGDSFRLRGAFSFVIILPILIPAISFTMGLQYIFLKWGLSNTWWGVALAHIICSLPYSTMILIDGMSAVGTGYEEQARVLGAGSLCAFSRTTLPLLTTPIVTSFAMAYIVSFSQYFVTLLIGGGLVKTYAIVMVPYIQGGQRNIAAAYAMVFLGASYLVFAVIFAATAGLRRRAKGGLYL